MNRGPSWGARAVRILSRPAWIGLFCCAALPAQRGADFIATDARAAGRGGVDVAIAEDLSALLSNPAGLTQIAAEWRFDVTGRAFLIHSEYEDTYNPDRVTYDHTLLAPYLAMAWDPHPGDAGEAGDWRLALGLQHVAGFRSDLALHTQDFVDPLETHRSVDYLYTGLHLGSAWQITKEVSFGATLSVTESTLHDVEPLEIPVFTFQGLSPLSIPWGQLLNQQFGIRAVRIEGTIDTEPTLGLGATFGFLWKPDPSFNFGVTWRTPGFQRDYRGDVTVDISRIFGEPDPVTFPDGFVIHYDGRIVGFDYPQAFATGCAWRPTPETRLATELRWTNWSATHDQLVIDLKNGDNPGFNAFVGADHLRVREPLRWTDQFSAALGFEWEFAPGWTARTGGSAQNSPVPVAAANPNAPGYLTFQVAAGVGYRGDGWSVDLAWQHSFERTIRVDHSVVSSDFDGSTQAFGVDSVLLSVSLWF